jgi:hypothetical protein
MGGGGLWVLNEKDVVEYIFNNEFSMIPYNFTKKYNSGAVKVFDDKKSKMKYVIYNEKKLYFPRFAREEEIRALYNWLLIEQDVESPHKYEAPGFFVNSGDIAADIGASEGLFSLSVIDRVKLLYIFECEKSWNNALKKTFEPWKDKVKIINKYVGDKNNKNCTTLDSFFKDKEINYIKADIEGAEIPMLLGAKDILQRENIKFSICAYHRQDDAETLHKIFTQNNYFSEYSKGYMLVLNDAIKPPYLRHGLIRASKSKVY